MTKKVEVIPAEQVLQKTGGSKRTLRVAAYCRVSTDEEKQLGSFENQIDYFTRIIKENSRYELAGIFSDEGISGCSTRSRKGFRAMIEACEAGGIDLVITKSISRFARNTQDSLNYTRKLKDMGVGVYFEKEGINTMESSGELLLTLFSCFAQEESRSISENTAWGIRSKFQQGIPHLNVGILLGYDRDPAGELVIDESQADIVRQIYRMFLEGWSLGGIARTLNASGTAGVHGEAKWCATTIDRMLRNEKYKGALLMQKTYTANYLTKQSVRNTGQLEQYYIADDHPAIIPPPEWDAVQEEIARRRRFRESHGLRGLSGGGRTAFYAKLFCRTCGSPLQRRYPKGASKPYWECAGVGRIEDLAEGNGFETQRRRGKGADRCSTHIQERILRAKFCEAFNYLVEHRAELSVHWEQVTKTGTPLEQIRAQQMIEITAGGPVPYEIPELTQAILQEAYIERDGTVTFTFLSGDVYDTCT